MTVGAGQTQAEPKVPPDAKKAKAAYEQGLLAEQTQNWDTAYESYVQAVTYAPNERKYLLRREYARSQLVESHMDLAERDTVSGKLQDAERELTAAHNLDPTNEMITDRLSELAALEPAQQRQAPAQAELAGEVHLNYQPGKKSFNYRGDIRGAYEEVARQFGVQVTFDQDLPATPVRFQVDDVDFLQTMQILADMGGTFWRSLTPHMMFVAQDTPDKRKEYDTSVARTILLPASESPDRMTEVLRTVREITGLTRTYLDENSHSITVRGAPHDVALAADLIGQLEQPPGELVLEIEVMEVDRNYAQELGIEPPQTANAFSVSSADVQEAEQSATGLLSVLEAIFGSTPTGLAGLTSAQLASELASGQLNLASTFPFILFGGGYTTFLAQLPGSAANFSELLSLVQHGRRILLRAEDGKPATFFVGEKYPIQLGAYSSGLTSSATVSSADFPIKDYLTGKSPSFVTTASLRDNGINDLIVANTADDTISVLLGNAQTGNSGAGDGTFGAQTTFPTGKAPVWIATGVFNNGAGVTAAVVSALRMSVSSGCEYQFILSAPVSLAVGQEFTVSGDTNSLLNGTFATSSVTGQTVAAINSSQQGCTPQTGTGGTLTIGPATDLAVANSGDNTVSILMGDGTGSFPASLSQTLKTGNTPVSVVTADFDGDGNLDLAVACQKDNVIDIFFGNSSGTFSSTPDETIALPAGFQPTGLAVADFRGIGREDLAVADRGNNTVSVLLNAGGRTATFPARADYPVGNLPVYVATGSFGGSGVSLAVANSGEPTTINSALVSGNSVSILLGNGDGTFNTNTEVNYPAGTDPVSIAVADYNLDSIPDLAVADAGDNAISLLFGQGNGIFTLNQELSLSPDTNPLSIVTADFNDDGRPDVAVAENDSGVVSVVLNEINFSNQTGNAALGFAEGAYPAVQYMDIGVKVKATPRIHPDDEVTLVLDFEITSLSGLSNDGNPVINNDSVEQTVRVKENETSVLAGVMEPQVTSAINGTPGLADLPVAGWLGKNQNTQDQNIELLILVTPRAVRLAPRKNETIYAGQGSPEGRTGGEEPAALGRPAREQRGGVPANEAQPLVTPPPEGQPPPETPRYPQQQGRPY